MSGPATWCTEAGLKLPRTTAPCWFQFPLPPVTERVFAGCERESWDKSLPFTLVALGPEIHLAPSQHATVNKHLSAGTSSEPWPAMLTAQAPGKAQSPHRALCALPLLLPGEPITCSGGQEQARAEPGAHTLSLRPFTDLCGCRRAQTPASMRRAAGVRTTAELWEAPRCHRHRRQALGGLGAHVLTPITSWALALEARD